MDFSSVALRETIQSVLREMRFKQMTPIQAASIPILLSGADFIGSSPTGSGKTAAFVLPILEHTDLAVTQTQALILCPTRELCDQVLRECRKFSRAMPGFRALALVGGQPFLPQRQTLELGVHLLVGTPGRTLEHLRNDNVDVTRCRILVLDEADRMLEEGFAEEMEAILVKLSHRRQTIFFSATIPPSMEALSGKYQSTPRRVCIEDAAEAPSAIDQYLYEAEKPDKSALLKTILNRHPSSCTLIFCRTKATVNELGQMLTELKIINQVLHGDLDQAERDRATALFRNGSLRILVATDVAARGLDIDTLELVINFDLPSSANIYLHRIGRTGRAGRAGTAVSIATAYETGKVAEIEALTKVKMIRRKNDGAGLKSQSNFSLQTTTTKTVQISGGRLDKLRPGDILGALTAEPKPLFGAEVGKIEIHDRFSYVAIQSESVEKAIQKLRQGKIKGTKFKAYLVET